MKRVWKTGFMILLASALLLGGCTPNPDEKRNPGDTGSGGGARGGGGTGGMGGGTSSGG